MSQITTFFPTQSGPGSGTVTSVSGGTGINITGNPAVNPTVNLNVPVVIANGGTNTTSFTNTDGVVYFDGTRLNSTTVGTAGQVLTSNGAGVAPTYQNAGGGTVTSVTAGTGITITGSPTVNPTVSLTIPVSLGNGGTNATSFANADGVIYYDGIRLNSTTVGTAGQVLTSQGAGLPPIFSANAATITFHTDSGTATDSGGAITIAGGHDINTSGAAATVTVALNNTITLGDLSSVTGSAALTVSTGDIHITGGGLFLPNTTNTTLAGAIYFSGSLFVQNYGTNNTFLGASAGNTSLTTGSAVSNTAVGKLAMTSLTVGADNTAIGTTAMQQCTSGTGNTAGGFQAMQDLVGGSNNTGFGVDALGNTTSSSNNTAVGYQALGEVSTAVGNNVAVGYQAGNQVLTGQSNILLGTSAGTNYQSSESSNIIIGNSGTTSESNVIRIGTTGGGTGQQSSCFIAAVNGVNVGSTAVVATVASTGQFGTATITAGTNVSVTTGANTITIASGTTSIVNNYTGVNHAASPYAALSTDYYISADVTAGVITIQLPNAPTTGRVFVVKDKVGLAGTSNITVTTVGGAVNIDGATTFVMNTAYEAANFIFNGSSYEVF